MGAIGSIVETVATVLYPPVCPSCGVETGTPRTLCPTCWQTTEFVSGARCGGCGRPVPGLGAEDDSFRCDECLSHPRAWDRGAAALAYRGTARRLVLRLKHGDRLDTVPMLGRWMSRAGGHLLADADLIAPVPLHWTRRLKRRCNQAAELARWLASDAGKPEAFAPGLMQRLRATGSQEGRDRTSREANLAGSIAVPARARWKLSGRRVLVIDDVLTTGATLNACAAALKGAGATGVDVLVIALVIREGFAHVTSVGGTATGIEEDDDGR